ncbi:MAG: hypothetical protein AABZ60_04205, partial [Planctomycetota bacterium]
MTVKFVCFLLLASLLAILPLQAQSKEEIKRELKKYTLQLDAKKREEFLNKLHSLNPEQREVFLKKFHKKVTQFSQEQKEQSLIKETWKDTPSQERREMVRDFGKFIVAPSSGSFLDNILEVVPPEFLDEAEGWVRKASENPEVQKAVEMIMDFQQMSREEQKEVVQNLLQEGKEHVDVFLRNAEDQFEVFLNDAEIVLQDVGEQLEIGLKKTGRDLDRNLYKALIASKKFVTRQKDFSKNLHFFWNLPESTQKELLKLSPKQRCETLKELRTQGKVISFPQGQVTSLATTEPLLVNQPNPRGGR